MYASIITYRDGSVDCEFLDSEPTDSFIEGVEQAAAEDGNIARFTIREGNVNGGDSVTVHDAFYPPKEDPVDVIMRQYGMTRKEARLVHIVQTHGVGDPVWRRKLESGGYSLVDIVRVLAPHVIVREQS